MSAIERFTESARRLGVEPHVRRFPEGTKTAADAAKAIGCDVAQIVKSLVFMADGDPVLALLSGADRLDTARLAAATGATSVRRADGDEVRAATGFAIGGVPPLGHDRPLTVLIDERLLSHDVVWAAAGLPDAVFSVSPIALQAATGARLASLAVTEDAP